MSKKDIDWCSLIPDYPVSAYCTVVTFADQAMETCALYPLELIYPTPDAAASYAAEIIPKLEDDNPGYMALDHITLFPLLYKKSYLLQPHYWQDPSLDYSPLDRAQQFVKIAKMPEAFSLLVTPAQYRRRRWDFTGAIPFFADTTDEQVEKFMLHSDWPVERRAKYAAIYSVDTPIHINWMTGKIGASIGDAYQE